ncbi:hypothetical protein V8G54_026197 [Vigna mungo]|uniref:Uncharacterized protein n=1 Tax=Vigna mungo TaxID=3915 RepID=A0AAQ3MZ69_VIGMU
MTSKLNSTQQLPFSMKKSNGISRDSKHTTKTTLSHNNEICVYLVQQKPERFEFKPKGELRKQSKEKGREEQCPENLLSTNFHQTGPLQLPNQTLFLLFSSF